MYEDILDALKDGLTADELREHLDASIESAQEQIAEEEGQAAKENELENARETLAIAIVDYLLTLGVVSDDRDTVVDLVEELQDYMEGIEPYLDVIKELAEQTTARKSKTPETVFDSIRLFGFPKII